MSFLPLFFVNMSSLSVDGWVALFVVLTYVFLAIPPHWILWLLQPFKLSPKTYYKLYKIIPYWEKYLYDYFPKVYRINLLSESFEIGYLVTIINQGCKYYNSVVYAVDHEECRNFLDFLQKKELIDS